MATAKNRTRSRRAGAARTRRRSRKAPEPQVPLPLPPLSAIAEPPAELGVEPELETAPAIESAADLGLPLETPEVQFSERVEPAEPERPVPASRRAIFFDVENTSRAQHIARVVEHLGIERRNHRTEFFAVGNWRVIGHDTARLLARSGAHLVHSAPSVGVRDWSDLRIAVAAGAWLAGARPGDLIEIVSDDRAFDAVGDVAASLGITYRRLSSRGLVGAPADESPAPTATPERVASGDGRAHRYRGRRLTRRDGRPLHEPRAAAPAAPRPEPSPARAVEEPHTAPHDEIIAVVRELVGANPNRSVSLDALANALKARGFSRPPGSPRLITRLRRIKEVELSRTGMITLVDAAAGAPRVVAPPEPEPPAEEPIPREVVDDSVGNVKPPEEPEPTDLEEEEGPQPGNERFPMRAPAAPSAVAPGRRRRRRGGRRRGRGRPRPAAMP